MTALAHFPHFAPVVIGHKQPIQAITQGFLSYSDFNFVSLFSWNTTETPIEVSMLNNNLVVRFSDYTSDAAILSFLGREALVETIETLLAFSDAPHALGFIGQDIIDNLSESARERYAIHDDRNNHDYILSVKKTIDYLNSGRKKANYNRFVCEYGPDIYCRSLNLGSSSDIQAIDTLTRMWQQQRGKNDENVASELAALRRCLKYARKLVVQGYGVFVKDELAAFGLFEIVNNDTAMLHFGKANLAFKGITSYFQLKRALYLASLGIRLMNWEQDLGIEGLRKYKESYHPIDFLKKYTMTKKT